MFNIGLLLLFIIFNICWFQLPGMLVGAYLLPQQLRASTKMLGCYFIGFGINALLYYFVGRAIVVVGPVAFFIFVIQWIRGRDIGIGNPLKKYRVSVVISFILIYVISFLSLQFLYARAENGVTTQVFHDFLFHTGNIASLSRAFPNYDIRVSGVMFYYHYFYELAFAMCKSIFKVEAFSLYMNGNAFITAWTLCFALNTVAELIKGEKQVSEAKYFFYMMGTFIAGFCLYPLNFVGARLPFSWLDNHFYTNGNALGVAASINIILIDILVSVWNEKFSGRTLVTLTLLIMVATGFKGTTGAMMVAATVSVFVVEYFITRRFELQKLLYSVGMSFGFVITFFAVVVGFGAAGANNRTTTLSVEGTLGWSRVGEVLERFFHVDYMKFPWIVIAILGCIVCMVGPCLLTLSLVTIKKFQVLIKDKEIGDIFDWFVIGSTIIAIIALIFFTIEGLSQGYPLISIAPLIFVLSIKYMEQNNSKLLNRIMCFFFVCGLLMQCADVVYYVHSGIKQNEKYAIADTENQAVASQNTMDAYRWLKDETPEDCLIAVDRHTEDLDWRQIYFYCSSFSERQCYIEGFDYTDVSEEVSEEMLETNKLFFSSDAAVAEQAMEENGINYLVVTAMSNPNYESPSDRLQMVYTNEEVSIYEFK